MRKTNSCLKEVPPTRDSILDLPELFLTLDTFHNNAFDTIINIKLAITEFGRSWNKGKTKKSGESTLRRAPRRENTEMQKCKYRKYI